MVSLIWSLVPGRVGQKINQNKEMFSGFVVSKAMNKDKTVATTHGHMTVWQPLSQKGRDAAAERKPASGTSEHVEHVREHV